MEKSIASSVLMIKPVRFGFNEETADSNAFQNRKTANDYSPRKIQELALDEFEQSVKLLETAGIEVLVFEDTEFPATPDSIFPNNWFSTDHQGLLLTYPLEGTNRALERRDDILRFLQEKYAYHLNRDLEKCETELKFLEGTGSLVIDHRSGTAFAALSSRTNADVLEQYAVISGNKVVSFHTNGPENKAIYHTNVLMTIADEFVLVGMDCIEQEDRPRILNELENRGKELILLSNEQIFEHFTGNALQLQNKKGKKFLVMSEQAKRSLTSEQLRQISAHKNEIIAFPLHIIELIGGGSARCMLAELIERQT